MFLRVRTQAYHMRSYIFAKMTTAVVACAMSNNNIVIPFRISYFILLSTSVANACYLAPESTSSPRRPPHTLFMSTTFKRNHVSRRAHGGIATLRGASNAENVARINAMQTDDYSR